MENKPDLKQILEPAREKKGLSQRKLAKKIGIHHSSLNDLENGRIQKVDIDVLRKIAEELDLSLEMLLEAAGYNEVALMLEEWGNKYNTKSTRDLKNKLKEYELSELDLLDDAFHKRDNVRKCRSRLFDLILKLENYDTYKDVWTIDKIKDEIKEINEDLKMSTEKYDYSKLPKK